MSGEAGGVLIGGSIALAVAPVIIAGAAAAGLAYGAIKIGGFLGKHAIDYAAEKKREKELVVGQCSVQLESLYSEMRAVVRDEANAHAKYAEQMAKQFQTMGEELKSICDTSPSVEILDKKIETDRNMVRSKLGEESAKIRKNIIADGQKRLSECVEVIQKSNKEKAELVQWADNSMAATTLQRSVAAEMVRDAEASYKVLHSMARSSQDTTFQTQVKNIFVSLERVRMMMDQGMYQGALSNARSVIRESAILASEHVQNELEMDMLVMELHAKIEGLWEEMKAQRSLTFCDETKRNKKKVKVDLNNFSQGKYKEMLEKLQDLMMELEREGSSSSVYEITSQIKHFDEEIEPKARHIMEYSQKIMRGYYERLHVLEIVADFMTEQDYKMDWAMPVGGDASQKLVVHFIQEITGNTISVTLDNDAAADNIAQMAMEILTFYDNGRPVTENEKKELRENLNAALHKAGLGGTLGCQSHVDQPSDQVGMEHKATVKNMPVKSIV